MPSFLEKTRQARAVLKQYLPPTRLVPASSLSQRTGRNIYLKLECELPTGSFKPRGAIYALSEEMARQPVAEVVTCSTGNHGAAVAYAARLLGVRARIFLPQNPNPVKRKKIADLGAEIIECGRDLSEAFGEAANYVRTHGAYLLDDATGLDLPAGPGTIALEVLEQLPEADTFVVPVGDSALIRGIAGAAKQLRPAIRIVGVQAQNAPAYFLSWKQGTAISTDTCDTIADGLATRTPNSGNVIAIRELVDEIRLVSDHQMLSTVRDLLLVEHVVAEPAGAAATAALLSGPALAGENIVLVVSGANLTPDLLRQAAGLE